VDFGIERDEATAAGYDIPFQRVRELVKPLRAKNKRDAYRRNWWRHVEARPGMLAALAPLQRFLSTAALSKHRLFVWLSAPVLPDHQLFAFARMDDFLFGILQSRFHEVWGLKQGTRLETRPRYTPTTCLETFSFPFPDDLETKPPQFAPAPIKPPSHPDLTPEKAYGDAAHYFAAKEQGSPYRATREDHRDAIAAAAKELNALRERWLNPPEWTATQILEFPGTQGGPWDRYIDPATVDAKTSIGTVRYPRLEPKDTDCSTKLKKRTLTNLYNERPAWLDLAHKKLDAAVADSYGWPADLTDEQILEKLLALNLERAAEEAKVAKVKKPRSQRTKTEGELI